MQYVVERSDAGLVACRKDRSFGGIEHSEGAQRPLKRCKGKSFEAIARVVHPGVCKAEF